MSLLLRPENHWKGDNYKGLDVGNWTVYRIQIWEGAMQKVTPASLALCPHFLSLLTSNEWDLWYHHLLLFFPTGQVSASYCHVLLALSLFIARMFCVACRLMSPVGKMDEARGRERCKGVNGPFCVCTHTYAPLQIQPNPGSIEIPGPDDDDDDDYYITSLYCSFPTWWLSSSSYFTCIAPFLSLGVLFSRNYI